VRLGDVIFTLLKANVKGLAFLKKRFLDRPTKACFVEAEIASMLAYNGFEVEMLSEAGTRGQNFDLIATKSGISLSVEITAKEENGALTFETISNTLKKKRTQVPTNRPAILYIRVLAEWMADLANAQVIFTEAIGGFFLRSQRSASDTPRCWMIHSSTRVTRRLDRQLSTSIARHSRV
jgi:hypothetical protein